MAAKGSRKRPPAKRKSSGFTVTIRSTPQVRSELDRLTQMGLFGNSRSEVAEELMRAHIRQLYREGWFERFAAVAGEESAHDGAAGTDRGGGPAAGGDRD